MAKELPYFKFEPGAWENGNIQMCTPLVKAIFIDLCCAYWSRLGELPYALALQKHCNGNNSALQMLEEHQIITVKDGFILIEFLEEQLSEFNQVSQKRRNAANKRWNDASALQMQSKSNAIREEKKREEKRREDKNVSISEGAVPATLDKRRDDFMQRVSAHLPTYEKKMLREFFDYWTEMNEGGKKMRFEMQKVFDLKKRLATWLRNEQKSFKNNGKQITKIGGLREDFARRVIDGDKS